MCVHIKCVYILSVCVCVYLVSVCVCACVVDFLHVRACIHMYFSRICACYVCNMCTCHVCMVFSSLLAGSTCSISRSGQQALRVSFPTDVQLAQQLLCWSCSWTGRDHDSLNDGMHWSIMCLYFLFATCMYGSCREYNYPYFV